MAIVAAASGTQVATVNTEHSLTQQTGVGIYVLTVNLAEMAAGDTVVLKLKTKTLSGSTSQLAYAYTYSDAQTELNVYSVPVPVDVEIICTLTQTAGSSRSFPWKLLRA